MTGRINGYPDLLQRLVSQTFTISKFGNHWFVSFSVDAERLPVQQPESSVGIDLGVKSFATLSSSQVFDAPKPLKQAKTKLAKLQRQASKQIKGSQNQRKTYDKIGRLYARIARIRQVEKLCRSTPDDKVGSKNHPYPIS